MNKLFYICAIFLLISCSTQKRYQHVISLHNRCDFDISMEVYEFSNIVIDNPMRAVVSSGEYRAVVSRMALVKEISDVIPSEYRLVLYGNGMKKNMDKGDILSHRVSSPGGEGYWLVEFDDFCRK